MAVAVVLAAIVGVVVITRRPRGEAPPAPEARRPAAVRPAPEPASKPGPVMTKPTGLAERVRSLLRGGPTAGAWQGLEDALVRADVGPRAASAVVARVREAYRPPADPAGVLATEISRAFDGDATWSPPAMGSGRPWIAMIVGVNGTGKTTTIGKLADLLRRQGRSVTVANSDTFRAAAGEQLETWAKRAGAGVVSQDRGADPGAVAFDAVQAARARGSDALIVDTAGRLHTRQPLMEELRKVKRVIEKAAGRVDEVLLVLDATTGQNGIAQARAFTDAVDVTGVVLTKMDGTARGGIVLAVREELGVPVKLVGTGERIEDLSPFDPERFARGLIS